MDSPRENPPGSLAEVLDVALPHLKPDLVSAQGLAGLRKLAARLPPVARVLLECRLGSHQSSVDLSQSFLTAERDLLLRALRGLRPGGPWGPLLALLEQWTNPAERLYSGLDALWLEFDAPLSGQVPRPSVFAQLATLGRTATDIEQARTVAGTILRTLLDSQSMEALSPCLDLCTELATGSVGISYLGVMMSRRPPHVRLNLTGVPREQIGELANRLTGWLPDRDFEQVLDLAYGEGRNVVLCLDLAEPMVATRIGLELFFEADAGDDSPPWGVYLEQLVELGLCSRPWSEGLLQWRGQDTPLTTCAPWPEQMIVEELLRPQASFGLVERQLNHLKLVYRPAQPLELKAYLAINQAWGEYPNPSADGETAGSGENRFRGPSCRNSGLSLPNRAGGPPGAPRW